MRHRTRWVSLCVAVVLLFTVAGCSSGGDEGPTTGQDGEPLPGLTIDIEHFDATRRAKDRTTFWVDSSKLAEKESARITHVLENVAWETGDTYAVSVRSPIPAAERADYREFGVSAR